MPKLSDFEIPQLCWQDLLKHAGSALSFVYVLIVVWIGISVFTPLFEINDDSGKTLRNYGLVFAAALSLPIALWRVRISNKKAAIAFEQLINSRFDRAASQLGAGRVIHRHKYINRSLVKWVEEVADIEARIGGLRTLQRIVHDNPAERIIVLQTICAYIEHNSSLQDSGHNSQSSTQKSALHSEYRADIRAAIDLLSQLDNPEYRRINDVGLHITNAFLQNCFFSCTKWCFIDFTGSDLRYSNLERNDFTGSFLFNVNFQHSNLKNVIFSQSVLRGADLRNTKGLTKEMLEEAYGVKSGFGETLLPAEFKDKFPDDWFVAEDSTVDSFELREAFRKHYYE